MGFISVCTALYDYSPQTEEELRIKEGELVYILEKSTEDDWWKAKKKASSEDEEEPTGLIPNNYVEEVLLSCMSPPFDSNQAFCRHNLHIRPKLSTTIHDKPTKRYRFLKMRRFLYMTPLTLIGH